MDIDERFEELSTYIADLAVHQDDLHAAMDRRFDALEARFDIRAAHAQLFEGWMASTIQGIPGITSFYLTPWPPVPPSE